MTVEEPRDDAHHSPRRFGDVEGTVNALLASAEHHAHLDPELYFVPAAERLRTRYRDMMRLPDEGDGTIASIDQAAVRRRYQNQGIGAEPLGAVKIWGTQAWSTFASLDYHAANTRVAAFYERRMGYAIAAITAIKGL